MNILIHNRSSNKHQNTLKESPFIVFLQHLTLHKNYDHQSIYRPHAIKTKYN